MSTPEESPLYPVCFDFGEDYPKQEWELLLALFCRHSSLSLGYVLSVAQHSAWIYCELEMQAEYIMRGQNTIFAAFAEEARALPDPGVVENVTTWNQLAAKVQTLPFVLARKQHIREITFSLEPPSLPPPNFRWDEA